MRSCPTLSAPQELVLALMCVVCISGLLMSFALSERNRSYNEGITHKTLLQVFDLLGNDHPRAYP